MALTDKLTAIGNAIRSKTGGNAALSLTDMATAISNLSIGTNKSLKYAMWSQTVGTNGKNHIINLQTRMGNDYSATVPFVLIYPCGTASSHVVYEWTNATMITYSGGASQTITKGVVPFGSTSDSNYRGNSITVYKSNHEMNLQSSVALSTTGSTTSGTDYFILLWAA